MAPPGSSGGFFKDGPTIAGHKISWAAIGGIAGVVGIFVVLRARSTGGSVASVGSSPTAAAAGTGATTGAVPYIDPSLLGGWGSTGADLSGQLDTLSSQIGTVQQSLQSSQVPPIASVDIRAKDTGPQAWRAYDANNAGIPVYSNPTTGALLGEIPFGSSAEVMGPVTSGAGQFGSNQYQGIKFGGQQGYISVLNITGTSDVPATSSAAA